MVADPLALESRASAQAAARRLAQADVRAVLVCHEGQLLGVVTRKTLVREVVAAGLDPRTPPFEAIAEPPLFTFAADADLDEAFRALEERDLERVPVVDDGRLVGVLSRSVVQRRLAEDEPPPADDESLGSI